MRSFAFGAMVTSCALGCAVGDAGSRHVHGPATHAATGVCSTIELHEMARSAVMAPVATTYPRLFAQAVEDRVVYVFATPELVAYVYEPRSDRWQTIKGGGLGPNNPESVIGISIGHRVVLAWQLPGQPAHRVAIDAVAGTIGALPTAGAPATVGAVFRAGDSLFEWPRDEQRVIDFAHGVRFDFAKGTWTAVTSNKAPPSDEVYSSTVVGSHIFMSTAHHGAQMFDTEHDAWRDPGGPKIFGYAYAWHDRVALVGSTSVPNSELWVYDVPADRWSSAGPVRHAHAGSGWSLTIDVGRYFATLTDAEGWMFDLESAAWVGIPPAIPGTPIVPVQLGDRAVAFLSYDRLVAFEPDSRTWCEKRVSVPALGMHNPSLTWGGASAGVYGSLEEVPQPSCPHGMPCHQQPAQFVGRQIGSVITW
ncbi:MAG: hypothetical protein ABI867_31970 [Kofleriaceae bacterium]